MPVFRRRVALFVVLACILARGIASAQTFTGVGAAPASAEVQVPLGDVVSYAVSGTFVGTVVIEQSQGGGSAAWNTLVAIAAPGAGTFIAETAPPDGSGTRPRYRFRCSAYTSGTIVAALSSAAAPTGSGTPGGADTQVQFNETGSFGGNSNFTFRDVSGFGDWQINLAGSQSSPLVGSGNGLFIGPGQDGDSSRFGLVSSDNDLAPVLSATFSGGTVAAPTTTPTGATLFDIGAVGVTTNTTTQFAARIRFKSDGAADAVSVPGKIIFTTFASGGGNTDVLTLTSTGESLFTGPVSTGGTTPAVANVGANSCGTTTATIAGNDNAGTITVGATSGSQCRVTFVNAAANRRECTVTDETTTIATRATYVDSTHTDFFGAFGAANLVSYVCFAR